MFIQMIEGQVRDRDLFEREAARWATELKPAAPGFLGSTWGVAEDGTAFLAARFASEADARANSARPEQGEWWAGIEPAFDGVDFQDCAEIDAMLGGGSDQAGFVQVIRGRVHDQQAARSMLQSLESDLQRARPDILGGTMAWHGDNGAFTQIMYFRSAAEAHAAEGSTNDELDDRYRSMMAAEPTFLDLEHPRFD